MQFDVILQLDNTINEAADRRIKFGGEVTQPFIGHSDLKYWYGIDPNSQLSYGSYVRNSLNSMGSEYSVKVTDMGSDIIVEVSCHNQQIGKSAQKTFLIKLNDKNGKGWVKAAANRYRTINGVDQAISYIRSASASLKNITSSHG
jgi:hypothetical protein